MIPEKYQFVQNTVANILEFIKSGEYVVPEIQRPFIWKRSQVRDLIDSLYHGYPTGYIITWRNPDVKTKDGTVSNGRRLLIDGQQRVTALRAALVGEEVLNEDFDYTRISIAFNPLETEDSKKFAVQDASHLKDPRWVPDISILFSNDFNMFSYVQEYAQRNPDSNPAEVNASLQTLKDIANRSIGVIELDQKLDIEEVTEIFIRINSKGTSLNQADFVMSKMAADSNNGGDMMWRAIDYFCHLASKPEFSRIVKKDEMFMQSKFGPMVTWLSDDQDDIYDPEYGDVLRVSFMHAYDKGKMKDLVSLLSGRDFATKEYRDDVITDTYRKMSASLADYFNKYNFQQFILALKGAGFISNRLLNSMMTVDFAYTLYLNLHDDPSIPKNDLKRYVQKWFVLSTLTGRYVSSPESGMDRDLRMIKEKGFLNFFNEIEAAELPETFWTAKLPQSLETSSINNPGHLVYIAAQIRKGCNSLFIDGMKISDLVITYGDVHHIFPREYLKKHGVEKNMYNQIANYAYIDTQVNKTIGMDSPNVYFQKILNQCFGDPVTIGNITDKEVLMRNTDENCIPSDIAGMEYGDYPEFLKQRRMLMAQMIREYYESL